MVATIWSHQLRPDACSATAAAGHYGLFYQNQIVRTAGAKWQLLTEGMKF